MSTNTKIEWTQRTWNVASGCTKVSDGCLNCYIERTPPFRMAGRKFDKPGIGGKTGVVLHPERLAQPLTWRKPQMVFVNSLTDLFHDDIPTSFIAQTFAAMARAPQHTFQLLTKRHGRMRALIGDDLDGGQALMEATWDEETAQALYDAPWPLPNLWLGVSAENQKTADLRIPALLETSAAVRWVSAEPLLGPIVLRDEWVGPRCLASRAQAEHGFLDWLVTGGESGPGTRPMHPEWARSLRDQCTAGGIAYFLKQWGEWAPRGRLVDGEPLPVDNARTLILNASGNMRGRAAGSLANHLGTFSDGSHCEVMERVGKKAAGRELDGRTWDQFPAVSAPVPTPTPENS